mmetsp:Transcript_12734/g.20726  ORF Transcript_12734/g.20726 Transcript_12734/m.20726 type:complete len:226 (-) Transcript_12734:363-1040(-)
MFCRSVIILLIIACLVATVPVDAGRKKKKKSGRSKSAHQDNTMHTDTLNPTQEEIRAAMPHLKSKPKGNKMNEDDKLELNSKIPELVEDVRFAVNNYGDVSIEKATALDKLGRVVFKLGKYEELLELSHEIVAIKEQVLGVDHEEVGAALRNIGTIMGKLERWDDCRRVLLRALRIHRIHYEEGSREMAILLAKMHTCKMEEDFSDEGISYEEYQRLQQEADSEL